MTTAIDSAERARFLQALRSVPDFRDEVRSLLLGEELLQLPERFAQFVDKVDAFIIKVDAFIAAQKEFNARVETRLDGVETRLDGVETRLGEVETRLDGVETRLDGVETRLGGVETRLDRVETRLQQVTDDLGNLKGHVAGRIAREIADDIAEDLGFKMLAVLTRNDLRQMLNQHSPDDISRGDRRSFYVADLVGKMLDQDGKELYLTLEASYTADRRDTDRAIRNAEFVTRFTGLLAVPAIASRKNDHEAQQLVEAGAVLWYQFSPQELTPE